jgi:hypothetical protein
MKILPFILFGASLASATILPALEVVMRGGEEIEGSANISSFFDGACSIQFQKNGNFHTFNGFLNNKYGWDSNQDSLCAGSKTPKWILNAGDGNFYAYCDSILEYSLRLSNPGDDHFMAIDSDCILHFYEGSINCDEVHVEKEIWNNIRKTPLERGDQMDQGCFVYTQPNDDMDFTRLLLQSNNGKLVLYEGDGDMTPIWSSKSSTGDWTQPNPAPTDATSYYLKVTETPNAHLQLFIIILNASPSPTVTKYFDKDLRTFGLGCFRIEYFPSPVNDLVAVPCGKLSKSKCFKRIKADCTCADVKSGSKCYESYAKAYCAPPQNPKSYLKKLKQFYLDKC